MGPCFGFRVRGAKCKVQSTRSCLAFALCTLRFARSWELRSEREADHNQEHPLLAVHLERAHVLEAEVVPSLDEDLAELDATAEVESPVGTGNVVVAVIV